MGKANATLGRYLCLVKQDWVNGLPILANSGAPRLKLLAEMELQQNDTATYRLKLADGWRDEAERRTGPERHAMQERALHWYRESLEGLPPGLLTIRAERRLEELEQELNGRGGGRHFPLNPGCLAWRGAAVT